MHSFSHLLILLTFLKGPYVPGTELSDGNKTITMEFSLVRETDEDSSLQHWWQVLWQENMECYGSIEKEKLLRLGGARKALQWQETLSPAEYCWSKIWTNTDVGKGYNFVRVMKWEKAWRDQRTKKPICMWNTSKLHIYVARDETAEARKWNITGSLDLGNLQMNKADYCPQ